MLNTVLTGPKTDLAPLLIVHGLFGSARNWGVIAKRLSNERQVISVDMRNHGESPRADTQSYADMAQDLAEVMEAQGAAETPMHVMGHSMGGKASMLLALMRPELIKSLTVADISPVKYDHDNTHLVEKMQALDLSRVEKRSDADKLLADQIPEAGVRAFLLQSLNVKEKSWLLNLDVLGAEMPKIVGWPDLSSIPNIHESFTGPTLFLSGGNSDYVTREHRPAIKALFPAAKFAAIPETGHWLHAEKPREFEGALGVWMERCEKIEA